MAGEPDHLPVILEQRFDKPFGGCPCRASYECSVGSHLSAYALYPGCSPGRRTLLVPSGCGRTLVYPAGAV